MLVVVLLVMLLERELMLVLMRELVLRLRVRRLLLLQLLDALLDVVRSIWIDFALGLGVDGLPELTELRELQLLLLDRVQQLLLALGWV